MRQVAERAGVSLKTVSRVMNHEPHVSPATIAAVDSAARELGFRVNTLARDLRSNAASSTVGLLVGDLANPFWSGVARGVEREIAARGLRLLSASTDENPELEWALAEDMLDRRVRALLVVTSSSNHEYLLPELQRNVVVTFLDRPPGDLASDTILIDNVGGAREAVRHLARHGHRDIALLGDFDTFYTHRERRRGFEQAMAELDIPVDRDLVWSGAGGPDQSADIVSSKLANAKVPTAIFALNNWITAGAVRALARAPESTRPALIGFDDIEFGDLLGVSVVAHDSEEMGRLGAAAALARVDGDSSPPRQDLVPTRLIARGSGERRA